MNLNEIELLWASEIDAAKSKLTGTVIDLSELSVVVHNASWCPDCEREVSYLIALNKQASSGLEDITVHSYEDKAAYQQGKLSGELQIRCLPTLIFYRQGKEVLRIEEDSEYKLVDSLQKVCS